MFEFLKIQYKLGRIDVIYLNKMVTKGRITEEEKKLILNEELTDVGSFYYI